MKPTIYLHSTIPSVLHAMDMEWHAADVLAMVPEPPPSHVAHEYFVPFSNIKYIRFEND
jgi:hypothetical protein